MNSQSLEKYELLDRLADEFVERFRAGERPSLKEYSDRYPELATEIRDLLPAMVQVEQVGRDRAPCVAGAGLPLDRIGDYRIVRTIGQGGMGIVYEAVQESLGRRVALKVLPPAFAERERFLDRFQREARAAAQLHHTNIVPVFGVGDDGGVYYYAMQFIQGQGLDAVLEDVKKIREHHTITELADQATLAPGEAAARGLLTGHFSPTQPLPAEETIYRSMDTAPSSTASGRSGLSQQPEARYFTSIARLGIQAAEGLAHAHSQNILHRDIKPSNLLLDLHGILWITDFGLAKAEDSDNLTHTGDIIGTVRYMAPERFDGKSDARSDVYALGITLYEMLTLRPPFTGSDRAGLIGQITSDTPTPPSRLTPHLPRDLETIVLKAMAREPAARYNTAQELADDLRRFLENRPIKARRSSAYERLGRWCRRNPAIAALLAAVFVLLASLATGSTMTAVWLGQERNVAAAAERDKTEKLFESLKSQARASRFSQQVGQRFDGLNAIRAAVLIARERGLTDEQFNELRTLAIGCLVLPDLRTLRELTSTTEIFNWDSDDLLTRYACVDLNGNITLYEVTTGAEIARVRFVPGESWLQFSPGGRFLVVRAGSRLKVWDVSTTPPRMLLESGASSPAFHPDGRHFTASLPDGSLQEFDLINPQRSRVLIHAADHPGMPVAFDAKGDRLALLAGGRVVIRDSQSGRVVLRLPETDAVTTLAWHPSGNILAVACATQRIHMWDLERLRQISVLEGCRNGGISVAFTNDGELLASAGWEGKIRFWNWRTGQQVLRHAAGSNLHFSSDGRLLVQEQNRLKLIQVATGQEYRTLVKQSSGQEDPDYWGGAIHPDGRLLAVPMMDGFRLWDLDSGSELAFQTPLAGCVAFASANTLVTNGDAGLLLWPVNAPKHAEAEWRIGPPRWLRAGSFAGVGASRDGKVLIQAVGTGAVIIRPDQREQPTQLPPHGHINGACVSPDGRWAATCAHRGSCGINVWETKRARVVREVPVGGVAGAFFSPDGRWLAVGGTLGSRILTVGSWDERSLPNLHIAAFAPDSSFLAMQSENGVISLLDPVTLQEKVRLEDPTQSATGLVFTPDGTRMAAISNDVRAIHVWDLRLIRQQLAELGLDWDLPPYPDKQHLVSLPIRVKLDPGKVASPQSQPVDAENLHNALALHSLQISIAPYHPEPYHQRGHIYEALAQYDKAAADFTAALRWQPPDRQREAHLYFSRAASYERLRHEADAVADFQKSLQLDSSNRFALNNLGQLYLNGPLALRAPANALALAEQGLRLAPDDFYCRNTLGVAHYRLGHYEQAVVALERSLRDSKRERAAFQLYFLAMCHARLGDPIKARECYDEALRWAPAQTGRLPPNWRERLETYRTEADDVLTGRKTPAAPAP